VTTPYDVGPQNPAYRLTPLRNVFPRTTGWRYLDWGVSADGYRLVIEHGVIIGLAYDEWPWPWGDSRYDAYGRRGVAAQLASRITAMTFPPGWREIPDPEAEIRRLADERARLETVAVSRGDLDVLLAAASVALNHTLLLPDGVTLDDLEEVVKRHGRRY
jgi:hypothetical protein